MLEIKKGWKLYFSILIFGVVSALTTTAGLSSNALQSVGSALGGAVYWSEGNNEIVYLLTISTIMFVRMIPLLYLIKNSFNIEVWYCMTRYHNKYKWFLNKIFSISMAAFFVTAFHVLSCCIILFAKGILTYQAIKESYRLIITLTLLEFFYTELITVFLNTLSIVCPAKFILPIGESLSLIMAFICRLEQVTERSSSFNPFTHVQFVNHIEAREFFNEHQVVFVFQHLKLSDSLLFFSTCIIMVSWGGVLVLNRVNLGLLLED